MVNFMSILSKFFLVRLGVARENIFLKQISKCENFSMLSKFENCVINAIFSFSND